METIKVERKLCMCCMEEHDVYTVRTREQNVFKGVQVEYDATYEYCSLAEEYISTEEMISANDIAMKNAYRQAMDLLTTDAIGAIRAKYGISQSDLSTLLGWGGKTITRYESHHVQDIAHNTILVKIDSDPEWFIELLKAAKSRISQDSFAKYMTTATTLFEKAQDEYLRKSIYAQYARFSNDPQSTGGTWLNLDKVVDVVNYLANATEVTSLYLVKLIKLLWYSDALCYKRCGKSMTGLVYKALPMGAVPIAYKSIIDLRGIEYEEVDFGENAGNHFVKTARTAYPTLTSADIDVLDSVIRRFGRETKDTIVKCMHEEVAYIETARNDVIQYKYAAELTLS